jgi:hypothetical protein
VSILATFLAHHSVIFQVPQPVFITTQGKREGGVGEVGGVLYARGSYSEGGPLYASL